MKLQIFGYTHPGDRPENEDHLLWRQMEEDRCFAVVADGLGSHGGGAEASAIAVKALGRLGQGNALPTQELIGAWLEQANQQILTRRENAWQMKTTAVALYIVEDQAIWAYTGDSRLYHFHNGALVDFTQDQSLCQIHVLQGTITRAQIPGHPDRSKILHVLGTEEIQPRIHSPIPLAPGRHGFLLCTDGLWERLHEGEISIDLQSAADPEQWLTMLRVRADLRRWEDVDNHTAAAVLLEI